MMIKDEEIPWPSIARRIPGANMSKLGVLSFAAACVMLVSLSACDVGSAPVNTSSAGESTPIPGSTGSAAVNGESATGAPSRSLAPAIERTRAATTYKIGFDFELGSEANGQTQTEPFIVFEGDVKGDANHLVYNGGTFSEMLGGGGRVETISVGNRTYLKGSTFFGAAEPDRWYYLPDSGITRPPFNVNDILQLTGGDLSQARQTGTITVDGQSCVTWLADFKGKASSLVDLTASAENRSEFNQIDSAEAHFSACADGLVHEMQWNVVSHGAASPAEKASISVTVHLRDFNAANIVISAPPNAAELK
jgi:hypothetical protein